MCKGNEFGWLTFGFCNGELTFRLTYSQKVNSRKRVRVMVMVGYTSDCTYSQKVNPSKGVMVMGMVC